MASLTFRDAVKAESQKVASKGKFLRNNDEALAVLDEEVQEARVEVYKNSKRYDPILLFRERVQVASICHRWACGLCGLEEGEFWCEVDDEIAVLQSLHGPLPSRMRHESLTRLLRAFRRVETHVYECFTTSDVTLAKKLASVAAAADNWASD